MDEFIIGIIGKSHGVKGFAKVRSLSGETKHFKKLTDISVVKKGVRKQLTVESVSVKGNGVLLLKFKGIDSPEAVRLYAGWEIAVPKSMGAALAKGEFYISDLKGCALISNGKPLATVGDIVDGPGGLMADVKTNGQSFLIPYTNQYFGEVDIKEKKIEFLCPWILE